MGERQKEVKQSDSPRLGGSEPDHMGFIVEGGNENRGKGIDEHPDGLGDQHGAEQAEPGPLFCPVIFLCPEILADKCGQRQGKAVDRQEDKPLDLGVSAASGHCHFPEGIDVGLDDHVGEGNDRILKSGRKPVFDNTAEHGSVESYLIYVNPIVLRAASELSETQHSA